MTIIGRITDDSGAAIHPNASVRIKEMGEFGPRAWTREDGSYTLTIPGRKWIQWPIHVEALALDYQRKEYFIIPRSGTIHIDFKMKKEP